MKKAITEKADHNDQRSFNSEESSEAFSKQWARYPSEHSCFRSHICVHTSQHTLRAICASTGALGVERASTAHGLDLFSTSVSSIQILKFFDRTGPCFTYHQ